jgi:hypothetical protein
MNRRLLDQSCFPFRPAITSGRGRSAERKFQELDLVEGLACECRSRSG